MGDNPTPADTVPKAAQPEDHLLGRVFNERYKVISKIARGGMGAVYRAEQAPFGRICALKVLNPQVEGDERFEFHKRFFLEASVASKLTHPNNVTIFDYGHTEDGIYFMAMEYLEGKTLAQTIKELGVIPEERASHIARARCAAPCVKPTPWESSIAISSPATCSLRATSTKKTSSRFSTSVW